MSEIPDETLWQLWSIRLMAGFTICWFFCLGACVGSFLNVIVWRWPLGRSVIREPSACPVCATQISWHDNIPILGWLRLHGLCRACGVSIPLRYPLVETLVGIQFVLLLWAVALTGGATLPLRPIDQYTGVVWIIWYAMQPELLRIYAWQLALMYVANIVWLIDEDHQRVPWSLGFAVLVSGLGFAASYPDLYPLLNLNILPDQPFTWPQRWQGLVCGSMGWMAGMLLGCFSAGSSSIDSGARGRYPRAFMLGTVGLTLGWQAAVSTGLMAAGMRLISVPLQSMLGNVGPRSSLFSLWLAIPVQLLAWRWLDSLAWWPGRRTPWPVMVTASIAILVMERTLTVVSSGKTDHDARGTTVSENGSDSDFGVSAVELASPPTGHGPTLSDPDPVLRAGSHDRSCAAEFHDGGLD